MSGMGCHSTHEHAGFERGERDPPDQWLFLRALRAGVVHTCMHMREVGLCRGGVRPSVRPSGPGGAGGQAHIVVPVGASALTNVLACV